MKSIVFLSGWGYEPSLWQALAGELSDHSLYTPSLSTGASDIDTWADLVAAEVPARSMIVAWSLGTLLALCLAQRHPGRVGSVLLLGATPCFVAKDDWAHGLDPQVFATFQENFTHDPLRTLRRFLALQVLGDSARSTLQPMLEPHLKTDHASLPGLASGLRILASTDLRDRLPSVQVPCTLLHGKNDALIPIGAADYLHQALGGSRLITVDCAGHAPLLASPDRLARLVRECST